MFEDLTELQGEWRLNRQILHRDGTTAEMSGRAVFTPDENGLLYHEHGSLRLEGQRAVKAERRYFWRKGEDKEIEVLFDDGRLFHSFCPADPITHHDCPPDIYHGAYDFSQWPDWQTRWDVQGPRKDYRMISRYRRP